jgi:CheY-like chemotaxis protein
MSTRKIINNVLLAEDDQEQCFFFRKALAQVDAGIKYSEVNDGDELLKFLGLFIPDILFLDLNMPCRNGIECIREIRADKVYDSLPLVVFTISAQENAIQTAYESGANLYFIKPTRYVQLVRSLENIFSLNWNDPDSVRKDYYDKNRYVPFKAG